MSETLPQHPQAALPLCRICQLPLSPEEHGLSRTYHFTCAKCQICGAEGLDRDRIAKCLDLQITVSHSTCYDRDRIEDIKNKIIPATMHHVTALNNQILTMRSAVEPTTSDIELLLGALKTLQECAANVSFVLSLTKDKIRIADSQEYAETVRKERTEKAVISQAEQEKKNQREAERTNPQLREKRKAIEGIMKTFGMTLDAATAMIEAQQNAIVKGKVQ